MIEESTNHLASPNFQKACVCGRVHTSRFFQDVAMAISIAGYRLPMGCRARRGSHCYVQRPRSSKWCNTDRIFSPPGAPMPRVHCRSRPSLTRKCAGAGRCHFEYRRCSTSRVSRAAKTTRFWCLCLVLSFGRTIQPDGHCPFPRPQIGNGLGLNIKVLNQMLAVRPNNSRVTPSNSSTRD